MNPGTLGTTLALEKAAIPALTRGGRSVIRDGDWIASALDRPVQYGVKRVMDVTISLTALLVLLPLFLVVAAAIVIENPGPVFFTQQRWGKGGRLIKVFKFRSMRKDLCDISGVKQTVENDPRVTRVGAMLRKTNLDELPQLINIFIGDMSLVGPRCHVPGMLAAGLPYENLVEEYHLRHLVRPGLTGLAQVKGFRGPTEDEDRAKARIVYDLKYIREFSLMTDIRILFLTFWREIRGGTGF